MQLSELTLVEVGLGQDLHLSAVTLQVNEDEGVASTTDGENTASQGNSHVVNEFVVLCDGLIVLAAELVDAVGARELVGVRVNVLVSERLNEILAVLGVLGRVLLLLLEGTGQVSLLRLCFSRCGLSFSVSLLLGGLLGSLSLVLALLLALFELTVAELECQISMGDVRLLTYFLETISPVTSSRIWTGALASSAGAVLASAAAGISAMLSDFCKIEQIFG